MAKDWIKFNPQTLSFSAGGRGLNMLALGALIAFIFLVLFLYWKQILAFIFISAFVLLVGLLIYALYKYHEAGGRFFS